MRRALAPLLLLNLLFAPPEYATVRVVTPGAAFSDLGTILSDSHPGDTVIVQGGLWRGPLVVKKRLTLIGQNWPTVDGRGQGSVIKLRAAGTVLQGFRIRNSGSYLNEENSGIEISARQVSVIGNHLDNVLFGIYLQKAHSSLIKDNLIEGKSLPLPERGDLIRVWYSDSVTVEGNTTRFGRDIVLWFSSHLHVHNNRVQGGRYGIHFMYCDDAEVDHNILRNNSVGGFLMYSRRLYFHHNYVASNRGGSGFGIGLKDVDDARLDSNFIADNQIGFYLDNSPREIESTCVFEGNLLAYNDFGVALLPSVRRNLFRGNSFMENEEQVAIEGGGQLHSIRWEGNYWSDYTGYDVDGDGIGDLPYAAHRLYDNLTDRFPALRLFVYSPVVQALNFAAEAIPLVRPRPKLKDSQPRLSVTFPTGIPLPARQENPLFPYLSLGIFGLALLVVITGRRRKVSYSNWLRQS